MKKSLFLLLLGMQLTANNPAVDQCVGIKKEQIVAEDRGLTFEKLFKGIELLTLVKQEFTDNYAEKLLQDIVRELSARANNLETLTHQQIITTLMDYKYIAGLIHFLAELATQSTETEEHAYYDILVSATLDFAAITNYLEEISSTHEMIQKLKKQFLKVFIKTGNNVLTALPSLVTINRQQLATTVNIYDILLTKFLEAYKQQQGAPDQFYIQQRQKLINARSALAKKLSGAPRGTTPTAQQPATNFQQQLLAARAKLQHAKQQPTTQAAPASDSMTDLLKKTIAAQPQPAQTDDESDNQDWA